MDANQQPDRDIYIYTRPYGGSIVYRNGSFHFKPDPRCNTNSCADLDIDTDPQAADRNGNGAANAGERRADASPVLPAG